MLATFLYVKNDEWHKEIDKKKHILRVCPYIQRTVDIMYKCTKVYDEQITKC